MREALHGAVLVACAHAAVHQIHPLPKLFPQGDVAFFCGRKVAPFRLLHQRAHPVDALTLCQRPPHRRHHFVEPRQRNGARIDRLPSGRFLAQRRDFHVAKIGEHQRARDRRSGKHQEVHRFALARERQPLVYAETVLLIDDGKRKIAERHPLLKQGVRAEQKVDVAGRKLREDLLALSPALAAGEDRDPQARGLRQGRDRLQMLPRQNFGGRHERRLPPGFDHRRGREQRHHGFSRADVALQQPHHAMRPRQIGDDFVNGLPLGEGERIGEGGHDSLAQASLTRTAASRQSALIGAQQRKRELTGQKLVIGEPRPRQTFRSRIVRLRRPVQHLQRIKERGKLFSPEKRLVLPLRQPRHLCERRLHRLAHLVQRQAFGERIHRFDQRQLRKILLGDHPVRMHHLPHAVVKRGGARDVPHRAHRKQLLQILLPGIEVGEHDVAGLIAGVDLVGRARPVGRGRAVPIDPHRHRDHAARHHVAQFRPRPSVDGVCRQVEQEIENARRRLLAAEQAGVDFFHLGPHAGKASERGEIGSKDIGPHRLSDVSVAASDRPMPAFAFML